MEQIFVKVEPSTLVPILLVEVIVKRYNGSIELAPQVAGQILEQEIIIPPIPIYPPVLTNIERSIFVIVGRPPPI